GNRTCRVSVSPAVAGRQQTDLDGVPRGECGSVDLRLATRKQNAADGQQGWIRLSGMEPRWTLCRLQFIGRHVLDTRRRCGEAATLDGEQGAPISDVIYAGRHTAGLFRSEPRWQSHPDGPVGR